VEQRRNSDDQRVVTKVPTRLQPEDLRLPIAGLDVGGGNAIQQRHQRCDDYGG
jgi:hypothetical protein